MKGEFCAESIKWHLGESFDRLIFLRDTDSTNDFCKRTALPNGTFVIAASQSGGKGRMGRRFESREGGVFLSRVARTCVPPDRLMCITGMAAVAAVLAIEDCSGIKCSVKWTNDIILGGKKLGGILTELQFDGEGGPKVIVGIGINANNPPEDFRWDTDQKAGSILTEAGSSVELSALAAALIRRLDALFSDLEAGNLAPYISRYRKSCVTIGREVTLLWRGEGSEFHQPGHHVAGFARDIDDSFGLEVEYPDGTLEIIRSGEASVRLADGKYL